MKANLIMWLYSFSSDLLIDICLYTLKQHVLPLLISIFKHSVSLSLIRHFFHFSVFDWLPLDEFNKEMIKRLMVFNDLYHMTLKKTRK